jgi:hypothetical protein
MYAMYPNTAVVGKGQQPMQHVTDKGRLVHTATAVMHNTRPGCCHYWIIGVADGPVSNGTCKLCGEKREFSNHMRLSEDAPKRKAQRYLAQNGINAMQRKEFYRMPPGRYDRALTLSLHSQVKAGGS